MDKQEALVKLAQVRLAINHVLRQRMEKSAAPNAGSFGSYPTNIMNLVGNGFRQLLPGVFNSFGKAIGLSPRKSMTPTNASTEGGYPLSSGVDPNSGGWTDDPYFSNPSKGVDPNSGGWTDDPYFSIPHEPEEAPKPNSSIWNPWNKRKRSTWPRSIGDLIHTSPVRMPQPSFEDPEWKAITGGKPPVRMPQPSEFNDSSWSSQRQNLKPIDWQRIKLDPKDIQKMRRSWGVNSDGTVNY